MKKDFQKLQKFFQNALDNPPAKFVLFSSLCMEQLRANLQAAGAHELYFVDKNGEHTCIKFIQMNR